MMRSGASVCLFALLGLPAVRADGITGSQLEDPSLAVQLDDECRADGPEGQPGCALSALQLRARKEAASAEVDTQAPCHDVTEDEPGPCLNGINWAKTIGYPKHPDWYVGLNPETATLADWQLFGWNTSHPTCPRPCTAKWDDKWCSTAVAPKLWKPAPVADKVTVKVLSYNLYWWNLFRIQGGAGAGSLIKAGGDPEPFDVIGMQECEDTTAVFGPPGLEGLYTAFPSSKATCVAYRTEKWKLLGHGEGEVAMDMRTEFYGHRIAQWMRLQHVDTGAKLLFVNHHGPLSVNSGGSCGGKATAYNLLKAMAAHGEPGDVLILVGDFNANAASTTVQSLWPHLNHLYNGVSFGGVDNIFSNVPRAALTETKDLGSGGSDHHAITATLTLVPDMLTAASPAGMPSEPALAIDTIAKAGGSDGCQIDPTLEYVYGPSAWGKVVHNIVDPRGCCNACQGTEGCKAWTWEEWSVESKGPICTLRNEQTPNVVTNKGFVSGLPKAAAVEHMLAVAKAAF